MNEVLCPGCGEKTSLESLNVGDRIDCPNCANLTLKVKRRGEEVYFEAIHKVSCPVCDCVMEVPENTSAGGTLQCCGKKFILTYEFGAFALKESET